MSSGEPLKKKKKIDVSLISMREQRKMRKLEKAIRKQEMKGRILKPIDEIEGDRSFKKTIELVSSPLSKSFISFQCLYICEYDCMLWPLNNLISLIYQCKNLDYKFS